MNNEKNSKNAQEFLKLSKLEISLPAKVDAVTAVFNVIDNTTPETFFRVLGVHYVNDKVAYATTTLSFLAQQDDVDKLELGVICLYIATNYKDISKIALKDFGEKLNKADKKGKNE